MIDTQVQTPETRPAPVRPKTPQEVGEHAARYIEEHGWTQGEWCRADGAVCADGALLAVMSADGSPFGPALDLATYMAAREGLCPDGGVVWFNDAPERTKAEVLAALRAIR